MRSRLQLTFRRLALLCAAVLGIALAVGAQETPLAPAELPTLEASFEPLRAAFNRDADKIRLLLLLDPT